jgi:hypothetical protein
LTETQPVRNGIFGARSRAWYDAAIEEFLRTDSRIVSAELTRNSRNDVLQTEMEAWRDEVNLLQSVLAGLEGWIYFEFSIPRMGRRIDVLLIIRSIVFVLEFKVGESQANSSARDQVWDYALDLKNFHEGSHAVAIVPILIPTRLKNSPAPNLLPDSDRVHRPIVAAPDGLRPLIDHALRSITGQAIPVAAWSASRYRPTPTILEAARALYAQHSVEAITRCDASAQNLQVTSRRIEELIDSARSEGRKIICFVTGVPGAGKTLVGLDVANKRREGQTHAVFLSGNGPLVAVLREALTRDEVAREKRLGKQVTKKRAGDGVKAFIQNVHHFRDEALIDQAGPPSDHVAIFDEAQRAWDLRQTRNFMQRKKGVPDFSHSEPEFLISYMDRHPDWAVIVCLVGGGQEINTGEAGIHTWIQAVADGFPNWAMYISSRLSDSEYVAGGALEQVRQSQRTHLDDSLHLSVSMRSFRAENVSAFVKALLDREESKARDVLQELAERYPIALTRDLPAAKRWIRDHARGSERYGVVASSRAYRLKPDAIDVRVEVNPIHWFLHDKEDVRSSYYMEDAATEFQVQGLELDWVCVTWDGDLRFSEADWKFHEFRGDRWQNVKNSDNQRYLRNAYRVLLTRARQGMVLYIPKGNPEDATRSPDYYDPTFEYLQRVGMPVVG